MNHEEGAAYVGPAYARAWECGGKRTIMYSASSRGLDLMHYSSPDKSYNGEVCGDAETGDNARVLQENFIPTSQRRDGVLALGTVRFTSADFSGNEADGVTLTLERTGDVSQAASVKVFAENDTAVWGEDFVDAFVLAEFAEGESTTQVTYPMVNDGDSEDTEQLTVSMKFPYRLAMGEQNSATLSVANGDENGAAGLFSLSGTTEVTEGDTATFTVSRSGGTGEAVVTVKAINDSARAGSDFVELNQQLVFGADEVEKTVELVTIDDEKAETDEQLSIRIDSPSGSAEFDTQSLDVTIIDNDDDVSANVGSFAISAPTTSVSESDDLVSVVITRSEGTEGEAVLRVRTADGTAIAGTDYQSYNQEVVFADGETEKTVDIWLIDDSDDEDTDSTFDVILEGAGVEVTTGSVTITLEDNDHSDFQGGNGGGNNQPIDDGSTSGGSIGLFELLMGLLVSVGAGLRRRIKGGRS